MDFADRIDDPYGARIESIERQIDALHSAVQVPVTGAWIEVPGLEATPFTKAVTEALAQFNNAGGDQLIRADAALAGVAALINGLQLLELNQQQLMKRIAELQQGLDG